MKDDLDTIKAILVVFMVATAIAAIGTTVTLHQIHNDVRIIMLQQRCAHPCTVTFK